MSVTGCSVQSWWEGGGPGTADVRVKDCGKRSGTRGAKVRVVAKFFGVQDWVWRGDVAGLGVDGRCLEGG